MILEVEKALSLYRHMINNKFKMSSTIQLALILIKASSSALHCIERFFLFANHLNQIAIALI